MHAITDTIDHNIKKGYPGPGTYEHNPSDLIGGHRKSPSFSVGTSRRQPIGGNRESRMKPGPGLYTHSCEFRRSAPKFAFGR